MRPTSIVVSPHAGSPPVPFGLMNGFKCACGALFASDIELDTHLKDEQHNASLLDELLKQATIHKRDGFEDKDVLNGESQSVARRLAKHKFDNQYHCPTRGCSLSFPTVQSFRRHKWAEQTTPKEYCPCCPFEATKLSKWLGHLKAHRNIQSQAMAEYLESRKRELIEAADNELALAAPKELLSCVVACNKRNFDDFSLDPTHDPKPPAATTRLVEHIADMNSPGSALKSFVIGQDEAMANRPDGVNETAALHGPTNRTSNSRIHSRVEQL
ncbi:hypothetical protein BX600DRAFT_71508 [Xylariales sp. PMI_506]|nr:hypothetical protein BX600DRAFT_71508 [Xylariales sp. PMI_506]